MDNVASLHFLFLEDNAGQGGLPLPDQNLPARNKVRLQVACINAAAVVV